MRKLWEDHITWTRLAIVSFADGSSGFDATAARLLQNQTDIGNAIKPYYGDAAGNALTALLHDHIAIAVELLTAAKAGDTAAFDDANTRWYANANDIADFLVRRQPPALARRPDARVDEDAPRPDSRRGRARAGRQYAASVIDYEAVHLHMLDMADLLSFGIMASSP